MTNDLNSNQEVLGSNELVPTPSIEINEDLVDLPLLSSSALNSAPIFTEDAMCGALEALIFMSDKPVPLLKLKEQISLQNGQEIQLSIISACLMRLQREYEGPQHGIRLLEVAEGYQFRTKIDYSKYIQNMFKVSALMLGPSALEVLAIIAYRQPISRLDIDRIRGVDNSHLIRALLEKKLIKIVKRADDLGRQVLYGTTENFLEMFGLRQLNDLPSEHELSLMNMKADLGEISEIKTFLHGGLKSSFTEMELAELDELSKNIKSISVDTEFTRSLRRPAVPSVDSISMSINMPAGDSPMITEQLSSNGSAGLVGTEGINANIGMSNNSQSIEGSGIEGAPSLSNGIKDNADLLAGGATVGPARPNASISAKSAFEILEEFVLKKEVADQNKEAAQSLISPQDLLNKIMGIYPILKNKSELEKSAGEILTSNENNESLEDINDINDINDISDIDINEQVDEHAKETVEETADLHHHNKKNDNSNDYWLSDELMEDDLHGSNSSDLSDDDIIDENINEEEVDDSTNKDSAEDEDNDLRIKQMSIQNMNDFRKGKRGGRGPGGNYQ